MKRYIATAMVAVMMGTIGTGCFASFPLTQGLYKFNDSFGNKWAKWGMFLVFTILPAYFVTTFVDVLFLNSYEFWSGKTLTVEREHEDGTRLAMYTTDKNTLVISVTKPDGDNTTVQLVKVNENAAMLKDADGELLASAEMTPDGSLLLHQEDGVVKLSSGQITELAELFMDGDADMAVHQVRATINGKLAFAP